MQKELELWGPVNRQLKQHGLKHVILADPNQMLQNNGGSDTSSSCVTFLPTDNEITIRAAAIALAWKAQKIAKMRLCPKILQSLLYII